MRNLSKFLTVALLGLIAIVSIAAVTPNSFISPQTPKRGFVQFTSASTPTAYVTLYTAGANGSRCYGLWLNSSDSVSHQTFVQLSDGSILYGGVSLTTGTTTPGFANGAPALNAISPSVWPGLPIDNNGNPYIQLQSGDLIRVTYVTAVTAAQGVNFTVQCSDF
jgi:hypothetical protein